MAYLKFNKAELVNLEYSLKREIIATNRTGAYANTTLVCCNTRKYHCLLAVPIEKMNWRRHALLSSLDETLIEQNKEFHLGVHWYGNVFEPKGHKYIVDYRNEPVPTITYNVGEIKLEKSLLMVQNEDRVLIKYTLLDANNKITLRLKPFLSFRSIHELTHCNIEANTHYLDIDNGKAFKLYEELPYLNLQTSKAAEYVAAPSWNYDLTYPEEYRRGFEAKEDLYVPGFFELTLKKGESVIFSAGTSACETSALKRKFASEIKTIGEINDFDSTIKNAANKLFFSRSGRLEISSGFSWLEVGGLRDTAISVSGLTLYNDGDTKSFLKVIDDIIGKWNSDILISTSKVESPLKLAVLMQDYINFTGDEKGIWKRYGKLLKDIVKTYIAGRPEAELHENGLLWTKKSGVALSWMNAYTDGAPVTERGGYQVETNAVWYNALMFIAEMEDKFSKGANKAEEEKTIAARFKENFYNIFWVPARKHLADYVGPFGQDVSTRPNQLYACCLEYSPIDEITQDQVLKAVKRELVTPRGVRTLAPKNPLFKEVYDGSQRDRDLAYHNGSTRPWLLMPYVTASFKLYGSSFISEAENLIAGFEDDMTIHGIGAIAEIYDATPPYNPHGAINSATATAAVLTVKYLINKYKEVE